MKKHIYNVASLLLLSSGAAIAQSKVKDGSITGTSSLPNVNAIMELESNKRGLLLPRIALNSTSAAAPLSAHMAGMVVYNTATAGSGLTAVTPGYYFNDGSKWLRMADGGTVPNVLANNGLTKSGDTVQLGGSLNKPTAIGTSAANTLALTGLQSGSSSDSMMVVNPSTGVIGLKSLASGTNIYNADGTLAGNRKVSLGANSIDFQTTGADFNISRGAGGYTNFSIRKTLNADPNVNEAVLNNSGVGALLFKSANGTGYNINGLITVMTAQDQTTTGGGGTMTFGVNTIGRNEAGYPGIEKMRLTNTGNLGIRTTTPTARLHVKRDFAGTISSSGTTVTGVTTDFIRHLTIGDKIYANGQMRTITAIASFTSLTIDAAFTPDLTAGTTFESANAIFEGGYVGIGTTSPTEKLDVVGNVKFSGAIMPNNLPGTAGQVLTSAGAGAPPTWTAAAPAVTTNTISAASNAITSDVNGVVSTITPAAGTITTKFLGFDAAGNLVTDTASAATTNTMSSSANTMTNTTNGVVATATIINNIANTSTGNTLTTNINGVISSAVNMVNSNTLTSASNALTATVNGVAATLTPAAGTITTKFLGFDAAGALVTDTAATVTTNTLSSTTNTMTNTTNGVVATAPIVNTHTLTSASNALTATVNGVAATLTPAAGTITTKFLGFDAAGALVTDTAATVTTNTLSSTTNTMTNTTNGVTATAPIINTVANTSSANTLTTTINGVAGTAVNMINSNTLVGASNSITSTVNGVASVLTPTAGGTIATAKVLGFDASGALVTGNATTTASNGLTKTSDNIEMGGALTKLTTISGLTATNRLSVKGTGVNAFSVDSTSLSVDATNHRVGIGNIAPTTALDVTGDIKASQDVIASSVRLSSDRRLKKDIKPVANALGTVAALSPVSYIKKASIESNDYNNPEIGFIAQDLQKVLPTLVIEGDDANKTLSIDYTSLIAILTKAIQEQQAEINELKALIKK